MWPERVHWVTSKAHPIDPNIRSVPLIGFPVGCLYRAGAIHAIESAGRAWHMAYTSSNLSGIQAAVAAGLGLSILSEMAIQADHRVLTAKDGFAPIDKTEVALMASPDASPATLRLGRSPRGVLQQCAGEGGVATPESFGIRFFRQPVLQTASLRAKRSNPNCRTEQVWIASSLRSSQ